MARAGSSRIGLRLRAEDSDDLAVISACLQDAIVPVRDLAYDSTARSFVLVANRFRWEGRQDGAAVDGAAAGFERVLCGIAFEEVYGVAYRGFRRIEDDRILSLLAIRGMTEGSDTTIHLDFAGNATIRLVVGAIRCRAHDFGEPWPTQWQPGHELEDQ